MATPAHDGSDSGSYPVYLSDALMGKGTKELYTGIRYNHKPNTSSPSSNTSINLQPAASGDASTYDLALTNNDEEYAYRGTRNSPDDQYVLLFDPQRKAFIIHQLDSSFDMNLTSAPWDQDATSLRQSYDQLAPPRQVRKPEPQRETKAIPVRKNADSKVKKTEKPKKPRVTRREPTPESVEEDSDDDMIVEYPDGPPSQRFQSQSTPIFRREESEESEEDADSDMEDSHNQDIEALALPSPAHHSGAAEPEEEIDDLDLEAEIAEALENEAHGDGARDDESSESEEE